MASKDELKRLIDELPEAETDKAFGLLAPLLRTLPGGSAAGPDEASRQWLETALEDTRRGIAAAEAGVPPQELAAWLARLEAGSQPIRWDPERGEFVEEAG